MKRSYSMALYALLLCSIVTVSCRKNAFDKIENPYSDSRSSNSAPISNWYNLPVRVSGPFHWGVVGHPLTQTAYLDNVPLQMSLLRELQATSYRVEIPHNQEGEITDLGRFNSLVTAAANNNIALIPVLSVPADSVLFAMSIDTAFAKGKTLGKGFASRYKQHFNYYLLGNQLDNRIIIGNNNGSHFSHYDAVKFEIIASFLRGMIAGIDESASYPKYIINNGGDQRTAWFRMLMEANVMYDIMGYHYYGDGGIPFRNIVNLMHSNDFFTRQVWFFVNHKASITADDLATTAAQVERMVQQFDNFYNVLGIFIDELFDEPYLGPGNVESKQGMVAWDNAYTSITRKPLFNTFKRKVEENDGKGYTDFVYSLYLYVNQRQPDAGLSSWVTQCVSAYYHLSIVEPFFRQEAFGLFANQTFQLLLDRAADASEKSYWQNQLSSGGYEREDVIKAVADGSEFWTLSGSNYASFVDRVYQKLLNRTATGTENNDWTNALTGGAVTKVQMVDSVLHTDEYLHAFVRSQYNQLLRRNGNISTTEESWAVGLMRDGMNQYDFMLTLIYTFEFWELGLKEGYERRNAPYTW